ncbi:hypothetical protein PHAVU_002G001100 [Phaseolus vulgaris]|uniref:Uncharacterized protein n=1 Tax=Phaseolus vulgaris TaxID=3885 RepID=V7CGU3_PHAVU|nr:hypothetical protein PHAVU_002G001100g [Phaseolus vulgaris]ESW28578.1 hypothetical protein PHAVU_002G001100g [Phaseolus vulgaris]
MDWKRFFKPKTDPQNPSTMPMLDKVMSITKGATDGISSVSQQANTSLRMLGTSSAQGAVGYGIGFGHGFGLGISMRAGVDTLQSGVVESMTKMSGLIPGLPFGQGALPLPETSKNAQLATKSADQISAGSMMQKATKSFDQISQESVMQLANKPVNQLSQGLVGSQPTKIGSAFDSKTKKVGLMQAENKLLQTVMKQQQLIDELTEENAKLCQILQVKDLKIPCTKLQPSSSDPNLQQFPSSEVNENGGSRPSR